VVATSESDYGLRAASEKSAGIRGSSVEGRGIEGWGAKDDGVWGISVQASGVHGVNEGNGSGVVGQSVSGRGVHGISETFQGVLGQSTKNAGVVGESREFHAMFGVSHDRNNGGVFGTNDAGGFGVIGVSENGIGVHGKGGKLAGRFEGEVEISGHLHCADVHVPNADCAEDFDIADSSQAEPGTVMVLGAEGILEESSHPYDKRVAGVVSGAGCYKPGIVLDKQAGENVSRKAIALLGKTHCKVDASLAPIEVGDLLTTSETPGHAMKAANPQMAFGAVIGKALRPLAAGKGLIPILIALQ
jgi:hypothetical protein